MKQKIANLSHKSLQSWASSTILILSFYLAYGNVQAASQEKAKPKPQSSVVLSPGKIFQKAQQSIVTIITRDINNNIFGQGSGVVISEGVVVTNLHVVEDAYSIEILSNQTNIPIKCVRHSETHDLAYLFSTATVGKPADLGNSNLINIGDKTYAIGAPKGLEHTLSDGIISSIREEGADRYIQTTAPISPGSSGGGLFDKTGRLIGITTFTIRNGQNLNFAIPIEYVQPQSSSNKVTCTLPINEQEGSFISRIGKLEATESWAEIVSEAEKWIKKHPTSSTGHLFLAEGQLLLVNIDSAIINAKKALELDLKDSNSVRRSQAFAIIGGGLEVNEKKQDALDFFQRAYDASPSNDIAKRGILRLALDLAYSEVQSGIFEESLKHINLALRIDPSSAQAYLIKGWVYQQQRNPQSAIAAWERYVRMNPPKFDTRVLEILAILYAGSAKDYQSANRIYEILKREDWNRAMKIKGQLPWVFKN